MRVFEAIGAGAALATEPAPGLASLFDEGIDYAVLKGTGADEVRSLLDDPSLADRAGDARARAMSQHTYDERARRILRIAADLAIGDRGRDRDPSRPSGVAAIVDRDVEVQSIVIDGDIGEGLDLLDRDVRMISGGPYRPRSFDAAVIGMGATADTLDLAREYAYVSSAATELVEEARRRLAAWDASLIDGWWRFDARGGSYRVRPDDHPLR